jgi:DNA-directed RNA polymerase subunit RPC12/RpoP
MEKGLIGYCKECGSEVYEYNSIEGYRSIFECPNCCHPHLKEELWEEIPYYIKRKDTK